MGTPPLQRKKRRTRRWLIAALCVNGGLVAVGIFYPPANELAVSAYYRVTTAAAVAFKSDAGPLHDDDEHEGHGTHAHTEAANGPVAAKHEDEGHAGDGHEAEKHEGEAEADHDHEKELPDADGHDHASDEKAKNAGHQHDEAAALKLSQQAIGNIGLQLDTVKIQPFERTITVPGMVVERPGRTNIQVSAPLTGMIAKVWPMQGETVVPGQPLFELRLTHEEVVEAQSEFLKTANELKVVQSEIERLEKVAAEGIVSGKTLLERKYEQQKLLATQHSQRQRLLLHGLSDEQVDEILKKQTLLNHLTIQTPESPDNESAGGSRDAAAGVATGALTQGLLVEELKIEKGQHVKAGDPLCVLADYSELFVEGKAFEQDAPVLDKAANSDWHVTAVMDAGGQDHPAVADLQILYVSGKVDPGSRAVLFYVRLPNKVIRNRETPDGHRFSAWQFKPGQRAEILVPIEKWNDRIVLPIDALVQDGAESYVFEQNEGHFDRRAVRVEYRDQRSAVIANDGALTPGKKVAVAGAYQLHLAMKNKTGGAPDPHAGHNH